jgi:hypothetical protein
MQARVSQALDLVNVIISQQFAGCGTRKISNFLTPIGDIFTQINRLTVFIQRKSRVWLIADTGLQFQLIDTFGNRLNRYIVRQLLALRIKIARMRHLFHGAGISS